MTTYPGPVMRGYMPYWMKIHTITIDGRDTLVSPPVIVEENDFIEVWPDRLLVNGRQRWKSLNKWQEEAKDA